ncbi:MAG: hypothetical protein IT366_18160 [Candidatus Hydrogenedentes bacterium]|nr:hypothetical protein [Candidatus Hydrogenedentota bacterium]
MKLVTFAFATFFAAVTASASDSYLLRVLNAVEQVGKECKTMEPSAQEAATRLVAGGKLFAAGNPAFISELSGRAGGLMLIQSLGDAIPAAGDVVMFGAEQGPPLSETVAKSGAHIVAFSDANIPGASITFSGHATENKISPTLAAIIPAWTYTGVLIKSCARLGKMPVTYETIGLPGGYPRIQQYQAKGIFWIDYTPDPADTSPTSDLGVEFAHSVFNCLQRAEKEDRAKLDQSGQWAAQSLKDGKTVYMYCMGHFIPDEIGKSEIAAKFKVNTWNSGFTSLTPPDDPIGTGDLAIHIGYQHPPHGLFEHALPANAKVVYVDLLQHRDTKSDPNVIWIDPMWPWDDAVVRLKGYDIPMLPPSGIVNTAIAWEIYRLATSQL